MVQTPRKRDKKKGCQHQTRVPFSARTARSWKKY